MDKQCSFTQKSLLVSYTHHFFFECLTDIISVNKLSCGHVYADKQHNYEHTRLGKKITFYLATAFPTFLHKNATAFVNAHSSQIAGAADTTNLAHYTPHSPPAQHSSLLFSQQCSCCKSSPKDSVYKDCA